MYYMIYNIVVANFLKIYASIKSGFFISSNVIAMQFLEYLIKIYEFIIFIYFILTKLKARAVLHSARHITFMTLDSLCSNPSSIISLVYS